MHTFENSFVRGPSPSYSDEATGSDNGLSGFLSEPYKTSVTGATTQHHYLNEKFNEATYGGHPKQLKQGRKSFAFWTVITVLLVLTIGNLILTLTIIGVLRLGKGIQGMELIPEEDIIKFYGITDLDRIYNKAVGQMEGFDGIPVTISGDGGGVHVRLLRNGQPHNRLIMDQDGTQFRGINNFEIKDGKDGATIFTTHRPHYNMPKGAASLLAKTISATRLSSPIADGSGQSLLFDADSKIAVRGSEGISMDGAAIVIQAEHNIEVNTTQGALVLEGGSGVFLDMDKIPIVSAEFGLRTGSVQYKICVCMPTGILFRIAIPRVHNGPKITCSHFSSAEDPCAKN